MYVEQIAGHAGQVGRHHTAGVEMALRLRAKGAVGLTFFRCRHHEQRWEGY